MKKYKISKTFIITMSFFLLFFALHALNRNFSLSAEIVDKNGEIAAIDKKINDLEEMKKGYLAKVRYHQNQAERLQFIQGEQDTARKHLQLAKGNQDVADKIQQQIEELKEKKAKLLSGKV